MITTDFPQHQGSKFSKSIKIVFESQEMALFCVNAISHQITIQRPFSYLVQLQDYSFFHDVY